MEDIKQTISTQGESTHRYIAINCKGYDKETPVYMEEGEDYNSQVIQFAHQNEDGTVIPGVTDKQIALILVERLSGDPVTINIVNALKDFISPMKVPISEKKQVKQEEKPQNPKKAKTDKPPK